MTFCSATAIAAQLGYMPAPGMIVIVPKSAVARYTAYDIAKAKACAARFGIKWKIEDEK